MTHFHLTVCSWNSPAALAGNTGLYLSRSVSAKQSGWLKNWWTDAGTCVHCTNTCPRHQQLWPATWSSASLAHGKHVVKRHRRSSWLMENAVTCKHEAKTSLWTYAKLKPCLFKASTLHNQLFSESPTVYRGKHVVSRHFHLGYLKANKVSKSEGTRKVKYAYHFWKCANAVDQKL